MQSNKSTPTIIVPMAGMGNRFAVAGYKDIKPMIPIFGKPMVEHVANSVGMDGNWIFIVQKLHRERYRLDEFLRSIRPNCIIIDTGGGPTEGAACSILLAKPYINNDNPLIVINSDNIIKWDKAHYKKHIYEGESDGLILTFEDTDPKWSFARLDESGYVAEVAEKKPISTHATAGLYAWKYGKDFVAAAEQMIAKNIRVNNEFYVAPVYNENIAMGKKISIAQVESMDGVGTPEDLERYINK
jgi:dTDP-glucose pyrophosphorylase